MKMKTIVCPISTQQINRNVVRMTGFMMAAMIALYAFTDIIYFVIAITIDYLIRAFTPLKYSPFSGLAYQITRLLKLQEKQIDKAPKIFAARVGFLFALATVILYYVSLVKGFCSVSVRVYAHFCHELRTSQNTPVAQWQNPIRHR